MDQVMDVARFIVNYSIEIRKPVSNLKLQKLLYFVQVTFLGQLGVPCYTEPVVHWRHGPDSVSIRRTGPMERTVSQTRNWSIMSSSLIWIPCQLPHSGEHIGKIFLKTII